jgi:ADP-sugar diphosphatase
VLLTVQPQVLAGALQFVELPAKMVDSRTFKGIAALKMKDELDLEVPKDKLINLIELAIPEKKVEKPGETTQIFLYKVTVPRAQLEEWTGKLTGLRDKGEKVSNFTCSRAPSFQIRLPHLGSTPLT